MMDEKYADPAVCAADAVWCPRNFLHRFQVTFEDFWSASCSRGLKLDPFSCFVFFSSFSLSGDVFSLIPSPGADCNASSEIWLGSQRAAV